MVPGSAVRQGDVKTKEHTQHSDVYVLIKELGRNETPDSDLQTIGWLELQYCGKLQVPMLIAFPWAKF